MKHNSTDVVAYQHPLQEELLLSLLSFQQWPISLELRSRNRFLSSFVVSRVLTVEFCAYEVEETFLVSSAALQVPLVANNGLERVNFWQLDERFLFSKDVEGVLPGQGSFSRRWGTNGLILGFDGLKIALFVGTSFLHQ